METVTRVQRSLIDLERESLAALTRDYARCVRAAMLAADDGLATIALRHLDEIEEILYLSEPTAIALLDRNLRALTDRIAAYFAEVQMFRTIVCENALDR